jgi:hypothetical protein
MPACSSPVPPFQRLWAATECAVPCEGYDLRIVGDTYDFAYVGHKRRFAGHIAGLHLLAQSLLQKASQTASAEAHGSPGLGFIRSAPDRDSATAGAGSRSYTLVPGDKTAAPARRPLTRWSGASSKMLARKNGPNGAGLKTTGTSSRSRSSRVLSCLALEQGSRFGVRPTVRRSSKTSTTSYSPQHSSCE